MKNNVALEVTSALIAALVLSGIVIFHTSRSPELTLIFNSQFYWAVASLALSVLVIGVLVWRRRVHSPAVQLSFGLILVVLAAVVYSTWEQVEQETNFWAEHIQGHSGPIAAAVVSIALAKNIISFGIAAIGASIAAGVITQGRTE